MADHRIYVFDLDGTLCDTVGQDYLRAIPWVDRIAVVNKLFDEGHTIIIDSARGTLTGTPWYDRTEGQLASWGVRYHRLRTGLKIYGDIYVDDRAVGACEFFFENGNQP